MATVHPHQAAARPAQARRSLVPPGPKLRDSCHVCAASKVKCDKEKPTCARCIKRGVTCEYFATKRAGRKHDNRANENRPSDTTNATQTLPGSASSTSPEAGVLTSPSLIQPSRGQLMSSYSDIAPDLLSPVDTAWSSMLTNDFNDFSASPLALSVQETFESESIAQPYTNSGGVVNNSLLDFDVNGDFNFMTEDAFSFIDKAVSELPSVSKPLSPPNSRGSTTSDAPCFQDFRSESSCSCLIRALGLLKQLFPDASTACARARMQPSENNTCQLPTIQCVLVENEQAIDAVSTMLQCQCSQDEYLLAIISLIVFKVLGWYAAAARQTPVTDGSRSPAMSNPDPRQLSSPHSEQVLQSPAVAGSYSIDGEDQGRMAAQLVLSKLHRVQQLVNVLSQQLKGHRTRDGTITPNSAADGTDTPPDRESTSHFSERMLEQLEADLRKRLRALSLDIVDTLR